MVGLVLLPGKNVPVLERSTAIFVEGSWLSSVANDFGPKYRSKSTALFPHGTCSSNDSCESFTTVNPHLQVVSCCQ